MSEVSPLITFFKTSLILCGVILIMCGTVLSLFYAYVAYQLIMNPEDVEIVKYIESVFLAEYDTENLIYGTFDGKRVLLKMSGQGKAFGMILLILLGVGIFSITARVLVEGGASILRVFTSPFLHEYSRKVKQAKLQNAQQANAQKLTPEQQKQRQQQQRARQQQAQQQKQSQQEKPQVEEQAVEEEPDVVNPSERSGPSSKQHFYNNKPS